MSPAEYVKAKGEKLFYTVLGTNGAHFGGERKDSYKRSYIARRQSVYPRDCCFRIIYGYNVKTDGGVAVFGQSVSDGALKTAKGLAF